MPFSEGQPALHEQSIAWSTEIHENPTFDNVSRVIHETYQEVSSNSRLGLEPHTARLNAANMTRDVVARTVAHLATVQLAPVVTKLLDGDSRAIDAVLQDWRMQMIDTSTPGITTDFGRIWYGDDARLILALGLLTENPNQRTLDNLPQGIRAGILRTGIVVKHASLARLEHVGYAHELDNLQMNGAWGDKAMNHFALGENAVSQRWQTQGKWQLRHLIDSVASGLSTDASAFLDRNTKTSIEHISGLLIDIAHGFSPYSGIDPSVIQEAVIANLHLAHQLAFMSNEHNGRAEYNDRYVWKGIEEPDCFVSLREPLVQVTGALDNYTICPNSSKSTFVNATRQKRGKCPGPDALKPIGEEEEILGRMVEALKSVIRPEKRADAHLDRDYSHVDTLTSLAAVAVKFFIEKGFARFDDTAFYLGPPEEATSNGPYILGNATRRSSNHARLLELRRKHNLI